MPHGPGKYDDECSLVRAATGAHCIVLLVLGGTRGNGFSVQGTLAAQAALPAILDEVARGIRADLVAMFPPSPEAKQ